MIKNIYYIAMALIAGMMVSCDPITESDPGMSANLIEADLQARVALTQTTAGQNKFTFSTNPTLTVQVLDQDGAILATGTEGSIIGTPPLTSLTVRAMNQDGSIVSYSQDVTINEYVDVPSIYKQLFGPEYNSRTWVWDTTDAPNYWGNGGYMSDSGPNWWKFEDIASGNTNEAFDNQCIEKGYPDDTLEKGWMRFTLNGKKVEMSRGESGTISWDLSAVAKEGWDVGTLSFSGTNPLLGVQPNSDNAPEYNYHILVSDDNHLYLCAPEAGAGEGGTAWFWNFKAKE